MEIVKAHTRQGAVPSLGVFERQLLDADEDTQTAFQALLQQHGLSSFARVVARKQA